MTKTVNKFQVPTILVIFGITGDLFQRKILPALFSLYQHRLLPEKLRIFGFARKNLDDNLIRSYVSELYRKMGPDVKTFMVNF